MVSNYREEKFLIREINIEGRDIELVQKLERNCTQIGSKEEASIFNNMIGDPFSRIRFYPLHVVMVVELLENGELVGVVKGCIKVLTASFGEPRDVKIGYILGLRVSPTHRRMGIGQKLVNSIEQWVLKNGANYTFLATEKTNIPSRNLFTIKCNYLNLSSLVIFVHQPSSTSTSNNPNNDFPQRIKIEKLKVDEAISLYRNKLRHKKEFYPADIDVILKEKLSLGSWICYFKDEDEDEDEDDVIRKTQRSSWAIFSVWNNSSDTYNNNNNMLQITESYFSLRFLHSSISHARERISQCLTNSVSESSSDSLGYVFLYGLHGEGENVGKLMKYVWEFTSRSILGKKVKDCKVIIAELGVCDPLIKYVPKESCISCINDVWYARKLVSSVDEKDNELLKGPIGNVIVDPRDF